MRDSLLVEKRRNIDNEGSNGFKIKKEKIEKQLENPKLPLSRVKALTLLKNLFFDEYISVLDRFQIVVNQKKIK